MNELGDILQLISSYQSDSKTNAANVTIQNMISGKIEPDMNLLMESIVAGGDLGSVLRWTSDRHQQEYGVPLIHVYIITGDIKNVQAMIAAGIDINCVDKEGRTPLYHAALNSRFEIVQILLAAGADPSIADCNNKTALDVAQTDAIKKLLKLN